MAPKALGLDMLLPEPDRTSLANLQQQFKKDFNISLEFPDVPNVLKDNDAYLAHILSQSRAVGARYFYFNHTNAPSPCKIAPLSIQDEYGMLKLYQATGALCNFFAFEHAFESSGFTNSGYDQDGILRRLPLLIQYQDRIYPHLSLAVLMKAKGIHEINVKNNGFGPYVQAGPYTIPVNEKGEAAIRFGAPRQRHRHISAVDLMNKEIAPGRLKDKIVLIGSSAVGLKDIHQTPFESHFPGVEVQAMLMANILAGQTIILPPWATHLSVTFCIGAGIAMALLFFYCPTPGKFLSGAIIIALLILIAAFILFRQWSAFVSPGVPLLTVLIHFILLSFTRFVLARQAAFIWFKKLAQSQQLTLEAMVSMVETRDPETGAHIKRTQNYARALARHLRKQECFIETLTPAYIEMLYLSVPLHDIGKVGIPDRILLKEGPLTDEEFELMKLHTSYGRQTIERITQRIETENYLKMGAEIAGAHHEKWNGTGYPDGLMKEEIPLSGRIMTICDVYDALISRRCYKPPFPHEKSMKIIMEQKGRAFDPTLIDAFFAIEDQIKAIARQYKDAIDKAPEKIQKIYTGGAIDV